MPEDYCTVAEVQAVLPDVSWGTSYDVLLAELITRASRAIDRFTGREPGAYAAGTDSTRWFDGSGTDEQWIDELAAAPTAVLVAGGGQVDGAGGTGGSYTEWSVSDYRPWPHNALERNEPYLRLDVDQLNGSKAVWPRYPKAIKVTGLFGFASTANTPPEIVQATIVQAVRSFKRGQQGFQDVGAIEALGQLQYVKTLDPDVAEIVHHLRRFEV